MSATDELRRLLGECGVEHEGEYGMVKWSDGKFTYHAANAWPRNDPMGARLVLHVTYPTPEQAIAATLGRETCHIVKTWSDSDYDDDWRYRCSECGCFIGVYERDPETGDVISADNYCPNCGAEVVK